MKRYYVSHPFTGNAKSNLEHAEKIRSQLKERYPDICFMNPLGMFGNDDTDYCTALADAIELLSCCEVIILCPGWETSTGCRAEKSYALHKGIKIKYLDELLHNASNIEQNKILNDNEIKYCPCCGVSMIWDIDR